MVTKDQILSEIRRLAGEADGKAPGSERFTALTEIREADWRGRYWARWSDAVTEAGFEPNTLKARTDEDEALRKLAIETQRLGHLPTLAELRLRRREDKKFPSSSVYERLGRKSVLAGKLVAYCEAREEFADVPALLLPHLETAQSIGVDVSDGEEAQQDGFVYLLKSGRHYKIGRTNSAGRREYELAIQLPERAEKVHVIRTDDPVGIERYWHERFADRHTNGEWFKLTPADVAAFKRRRNFM
jgi:hypothetical protein